MKDLVKPANEAEANVIRSILAETEYPLSLNHLPMPRPMIGFSWRDTGGA